MELPSQDGHISQRTTSVSSARSFVKSHRSGFTTGAFVFTGIVALAAGSAAVSDGNTSSHSSVSSPPANSLQVDTQSNSNAPAADAAGGATSTNVQSSTNSDGSVTTNVTVNGQPVEVPPNGT